MKRIIMALALLSLVVLNGCGTGGVVSLEDLTSCWNEKGELQKQISELNQQNCNAEDLVIVQKQNRIDLLEDELSDCEDVECSVCEVCSVCVECVNETIYINQTLINETIVYINNCTTNNETNNTGVE